MSEELTGEDLVLIIEALDDYIPRGRDLAPHERQNWAPYQALRGRLQQAVGMDLGDTGKHWLRALLLCERAAMIDALSVKMFDLMKDPQMTRRQFREQMGRALRECRDFQFFVEGKSVSVSHNHGTTRTLKL